ncbi:MAG: hypothetical protein ABI550_09815, partial [Ignavibacteriaceae bacterium]
FGEWLVFYFHKKKSINISYNIEFHNIKRENFWLNVSKIINEIINSLPPDKRKVTSRIIDLHKNKPNSIEFKTLKKFYVRNFKRSINYKDLLKRLADG